MKISAATLNILKNFSSINSSIVVEPGSVLKTISAQGNIMATANVAETFDTAFAIYDLGQFLGAVSLFDDPDFEFETSYVKISSGNRSIRYFYSDPSLIKSVGNKQVKLPSRDAEFSLTENQIGSLLKAASVLQVPEVAVKSDGHGKTRIVAVNSKESSSNEFSITVDHESDTSFSFFYKSENLKLIGGDYDLAICSRGISEFKNTKQDVTYWIAIEANSKFGK
jgi:hypothetical protein